MSKGKIIGLIASVLVLVIGVGVNTYINSNRDSAISDLTAQKNKVLNQISLKQTALKSVELSVQAQSTGLDMERVDKDKTVIKDNLKKLFEWKDMKSYTEQREVLMRDFSITDDVLHSVLPRNAYPFNPKLPDVKEGSILSVGEVDILPISIEGSNYNYNVNVQVMHDKKEIGMLYLDMTVSAKGEVIRLSGGM